MVSMNSSSSSRGSSISPRKGGSNGSSSSGNGSSSNNVAATGVFLPKRYFFLMLIVMTVLVALQAKSMIKKSTTTNNNGSSALSDEHRVAIVPSSSTSTTYHESKPVLRGKQEDQCRFYLAESAVAPNSGMGMFTTTGLLKGDMIGFPDICIFVSDAPQRWTHLHSHSWGKRNFFGQYEGQNSRAACEGYATIFNTMPDTHINTKLVSPLQQTTAGVRRDQDPAAGSITQHYGIYSEAMDVISPGSELTINYGDWEFEENDDDTEILKRPSRPVEWLAEHGWCIDHLEIKHSTIAGAGRGAFVKRHLAAGTVVAPAPLQAFEDRRVFQRTVPEQLFVNYCFQPRNSKMLFYPYGPAVNLINHASGDKEANVKLQWSTNPLHEADLLELGRREFMQKVVPGHIVLEVVALRDLVAGEELFLDYGEEWEQAWEEHVANWKPLPHAEDHVYPEDMDDTTTLRTVKEQETDPYPENLVTMCNTSNRGHHRQRHMEWQEPQRYSSWAHTMVFCHILDRQIGEYDNEEYSVSLHFFDEDVDELMNEENAGYDPTVPYEELYIDTKVPRRAIRWIEKPYMDDEHLRNAFRHPIGMPDELVPDAWKNNAAAPRKKQSQRANNEHKSFIV